MKTENDEKALAKIPPPRLPYHPAVKDRFGIDKSGWNVLVDAVYPNASSPASVIMALGYCKARNLDPFKKCVHIVPIWDSTKRRMIDTVWPGIGELRTTAFRTKSYAGRDATEFGPEVTRTWKQDNGEVKVTFPEWAQITVRRIVGQEIVKFAGPTVYWEETFASVKGGAPNSMWRKRPRGQLDKCAEAAALRCAFPEELGDEFTSDEGAMIHQNRERLPAKPIGDDIDKSSGTNGLAERMEAKEKPAEPEPTGKIELEEIPDILKDPEDRTEEPEQPEPEKQEETRYHCNGCDSNFNKLNKGFCPVCMGINITDKEKASE